MLLPYFVSFASAENLHSGMVECILSKKLDVLHYIYSLCESHLPVDELPRVFFFFPSNYVLKVLNEVTISDESIAYLVYVLKLYNHAIPRAISQQFESKHEESISHVEKVLPFKPCKQEKRDIIFEIHDSRLAKPYPVRHIIDGLDTLHFLGKKEELVSLARQYNINPGEYGLDILNSI